MNSQIWFEIREVQDQDVSWIKDFMAREWGGESVVIHGDLFSPHELPGFIAIIPSGKPVGLVTYLIDDRECEIITLNSLKRENGIGTSLVQIVKEKAEIAGCKSIRVTTTNDNHLALNFYQNRGFILVAVHQGVVNQAREEKPSIPLVSPGGVPIQDEIELALLLNRN